MDCFYDCEFLENGRTIRLISIGMVCEDGREYYAILSDPLLIRDALAHPWLRKNVIPSLPVIPRDDGLFLWDEEHPDFKNIKTREQVASDVLKFLDVDNPQLWAWYGAYDHVALCQIWGSMVDLPMGIPQWTNDLRQEYERLGRPRMPEQPFGNHNALEDARYNMFRSFFMRNLTPRNED